MFYQFDDDVISVSPDELKDHTLTVGFLNYDELAKLYRQFNIPLQAVELCKNNVVNFTTCFEAYDHCYFIKLGILDDSTKPYGCIGIIAAKELVIVVSINDRAPKNRDLFLKMMSRLCNENANAERVMLSLFESIIMHDDSRLEKIQNEINALEDKVIKNKADNSFNANLLALKSKILSLRAYYERLIDISHSLLENDNELFNDSIKGFGHFADKVKRLRESTDILTESVMHLWDAYQASINMKLNETMKFFTLVTTIFFPLTVIVGWYGMNFSTMPELKWEYGYIYVIILSAAVILLLILWFKRKKWI